VTGIWRESETGEVRGRGSERWGREREGECESEKGREREGECESEKGREREREKVRE